jgi:RNA polymerase sigma factor (sigma-70 family)
MPRPTVDISALYACHRQTLLVFFVRRTADTEVALDLWAETFAQAVAGRARYRGDSSTEAAGWLYAIAHRQLALYYRRGHAERRALDRLGLERPPASPAVEAEVVRCAALDDLRVELAGAIATLPRGTRDALVLRVVQDLPYPQVARRLAISEQAARARVSRGLRALSDRLDPAITTEAMQP